MTDSLKRNRTRDLASEDQGEDVTDREYAEALIARLTDKDLIHLDPAGWADNRGQAIEIAQELFRQVKDAAEDAFTQEYLALCDAVFALIKVHPVFRSKPVGAPGSQARREQEEAIAAEDAVLAMMHPEANLVRTWTDAPVEYDGFGTRTAVPCVGKTFRGTVRVVLTAPNYLEWQRGRYAYGMYMHADKEQFERMCAGENSLVTKE